MFDVSSISSSSATGQTQSDVSQAKLEDDLNKFLNLLVTQLKNQDPLDPMDATEFTSQLVQFASVEQQIYQNSNLEKLLNATHVNQVSNLSGYLGTTVEGVGNEFILENGQAKFTYDLFDQASTNAIIIQDASGKVVFTTGGELEAGQHTFQWDGKDDLGNQLPDGQYKVVIAAQDDAGLEIETEETVFGRVTAAGAEDGQVTLYMGDVAMPLGSVRSVSETPAPPAP